MVDHTLVGPVLDTGRPARRVPPAGPGRLRGGRLRAAAALCGPAFVVSVAYVDPGNFATNVQGGARYGYLLLWVVAVANLLAVFVQYLSAKIGIATGATLPELCRAHYRRPVTLGLWVVAELVVMATDLAEFVGVALALDLLFGMPALPAGLLTGVVSAVLVGVAPRHRRRFEATIVGMLAVVLVGFAYQLCRTGPDTGMAAGMVPHLAGPDSLLLATGIVGATVMPHAIYLHSGLTRHGRTAGDRAAAVRASRLDIGAALGVAGLVNAAMLVVAAAAFHRPGHAEAGASLTAAHAGLGARSGPVAAAAFGLALLAAGLASATVGTYAGQLVMRGFLRRSVPVLLRRLVTMAPALVVLGAGADPSRALVLSQVVLSFGIPAALIPLLLMTRRRDVMGELANRRATTLAGIGVTTLIVTLNAVLLLQVLS